MGCDTKGFVMTDLKDPFQVFSIVKSSLESLMKEKSGEERLFLMYRKEGFSSIHCELTDISGMLVASFEYAGEKRDLHIHLDCDGDGENCGYKDGLKIIFSFGMWGSSVELMRGILEGFKSLGDCYLVENDCGSYEIDDCKI